MRIGGDGHPVAMPVRSESSRIVVPSWKPFQEGFFLLSLRDGKNSSASAGKPSLSFNLPLSGFDLSMERRNRRREF